jgi:hypothetical protein
MSPLFEAILDGRYMDAWSLVSPRKTTEGEKDASGNGVMYSGELAMLVAMRGEMTDEIRDWFGETLAECCPQGIGLLQRSPSKTDQIGPDDFYGFAAGCIATDTFDLGRMVLQYGLDHNGSYNTEEPGVWTAKSFLFRQPQLVACLYYAAGKVPPWYLRLAAAASIFFSCRSAPVEDLDARRLAFLLIYCTRQSWLCSLAAVGWYKRLERDYGTLGMAQVAIRYYEEGHPFAEYWP